MQMIYIAVGNDVIDTFEDTVHSTERTHAEAHISACILNLELCLVAWRAAKEQRKGRASPAICNCTSAGNPIPNDCQVHNV